MKKCPTCEKTFEDSMRFCQSDGTPLVEVVEVIDPYKTMVARPEDIAAAIPKAFDTPIEVAPEPIMPPAEEEEVLQIPSASDPMKTQFVSEAELRKEMAASSIHEEPVMEIPPASATPTPPAFIEPDLNPVTVEPPPSPFSHPEEPPPAHSPVASEPSSSKLPESPAFMTTPPIPSPFGSSSSNASDVSPMVPQFREPQPEPEPVVEPVPSTPFEAPVPSSPFAEQVYSSPFNEPPVSQPSASTPQDQQMAQSDWTPPPAGGAGYQQAGSATPQAAAGGQSSTLAIVSLVIGILSLCCGYTFIFPIIAIVLGFMARGKANSDPAHYGGGGLALGGIICGFLGIFLGIILIVFYILGFAAMLANGGR